MNVKPDLQHTIEQVALRQFVDHGYDATTVRTIARDVGVTVPALYYHFENKQALLAALFDRAMSVVTSMVDGALAAADADPTSQLSAFVEAVCLYVARHRDLALLDAERRGLTPENHEQYAAHRDRVEARLRAIIAAGRADGEFSTEDPETCGRAILSMCQGIAGWYRPDGPVPPEEISARYVDVALAVVGRRRRPRRR